MKKTVLQKAIESIQDAEIDKGGFPLKGHELSFNDGINKALLILESLLEEERQHIEDAYEEAKFQALPQIPPKSFEEYLYETYGTTKR